MTNPEERQTFVAQLVRAYPTLPVPLVVHVARALMKAGTAYGRLSVEACNGWAPPGTNPNAWTADWWKERERTYPSRVGAVQRRIVRQCARLADREQGVPPLAHYIFGGDPRGYTVKLLLPNGAYNTMGGAEEGYGVPGS